MIFIASQPCNDPDHPLKFFEAEKGTSQNGTLDVFKLYAAE
jgi:hypothetical protein